MTKRSSAVLIATAALAATASGCWGRSPLSDEGAAGATGFTSSAGSTGSAGATALTTGVAGFTGSAGSTDVAGSTGGGGSADVAGTTGSTGDAGSAAPTPDASVDAPVIPNPAPNGTGSATLPNGQCVPKAVVVDGVCACPTDARWVCAEGCVDFSSDDVNCGACGHVCGSTATCVGGLCGAAPVTVAHAAPSSACGPIDLALAPGALAWTVRDLGIVTLLNLATAKSSSISSIEKAPTHVALRGSEVYWLSNAGRTIRHGSAGNLTVVTVLRSATDIEAFVPTPDNLTIYDSTQSEIDAVPAVGGAPVQVATFADLGQPTALGLDGDTLAVAVGRNGFVDAVTLVPGTVATCDAHDASGNDTSVSCVEVARGVGSLFEEAIVLDGGRAIWADGATVAFSPSNVNNDKMVVAAAATVSGLTAFGEWVYFATPSDGTGSTTGVVYKARLSQSQTPVPLARGQVAPRALATDGKRLYWSTGDCEIHATDL